MAESSELRASSVVSPTLPGIATEAAEPEGTECTANSPPRFVNGCTGNMIVPETLITSDMLAEEEKMSKESTQDMERLREQHEKNFASLDDELRAERYQRLQYLLSKSNMYTSYLVNRMEKTAEERRQKSARQEIRKQNQATKAAQPKEVRSSARVAKLDNPEPVKPVSQKRKASGEKPVQKKRWRRDSVESEEDESLQELSADSQDEDEAKAKEDPTETDGKSEGKKMQDIVQATSDSTKQPELLTGGMLRDYQMQGYSWLKVIYENGVNGILADEMGLGKTIQCIASIADLCVRGVPGPFLIVAPLSTVPNWVSEFKRFTPDVPCILYHGTKDDRAVLRRKIKRRYEVKPGVKIQPVVVTSYEVSMNDRAHLSNFPWKYLIVDEGHRIKNAQCQLIKELKMYSSTHRLLLTGTPLQNNLAELWSLLNFLLPDIFDDRSSFEMWFDVASLGKSENHDTIVQEEQANHVLSMLHQILRPFMLRRMKCDVELDVPPKSEVIVYAPLSMHQSKMYKATLNNTIEEFIDRDVVKEVVEEQGRGKRRTKKIDYSSMCGEETDIDAPVRNKKKEEEELMKWCDEFVGEAPKLASTGQGIKKVRGTGKAEVHLQLRNKLMLTRKICNHPYLVEYPLTPGGDYRVDEDLVTICGKMKLLDQMVTELIKRGHKILLFSQMTTMLDVLGDYLCYRNIRFSRLDGSMKFTERVEQIDDFNGNADVGVFLLSTRAGGLGLNLVAADTVIIYDSDWNPQCDLQAQDRCHRIGQTKPVMIYRLVTAKTIDQKIVERAASKRKLEKMVIVKGRFKTGIQKFSTTMSVMSPEMLKELLESRDFEKEVDVQDRRGNEAISKKDLDTLLSRDHLYRRWEAKKNLKKAQPADATAGVDEVGTSEDERDIDGVFCTINTAV